MGSGDLKSVPEGQAASKPPSTAYLLPSDVIVLENLLQDIQQGDDKSRVDQSAERDSAALLRLQNLNDPSHPDFDPSIISTYDTKDVPEPINNYILQPYRAWAIEVVRHPTDIVFLTHILWNLIITVPSAIYLFYNFTWLHGIAHTLHALWNAGPMTLLLHNHIHNQGVLAPSWRWLDRSFPYILEPLIGHTWDSYYYHHVKHHHLENNGPDDLSSTIRYQRDNPLHFLHYFARFFFLVWLELPLYFMRKRQSSLAIRAGLSEMVSYAFIYSMTIVNARASLCALILPLLFMRLALMVGNWGQHALVDEIEPDHDLRSSITLIDVPSNRLCFNDGYHTSHHFNPRRHWRDQPSHFVKNKTVFAKGKALVFHDIDFFMMTIKLLSKDYMYLAKHLVPIGEQINMSQVEIAEMLRTKTRKFSEEDIKEKFGQKGAAK